MCEHQSSFYPSESLCVSRFPGSRRGVQPGQLWSLASWSWQLEVAAAGELRQAGSESVLCGVVTAASSNMA